MINSSLRGLQFECSKATQSRDFLYIDDAINAIFSSIKISGVEGQIINIGSGKGILVKKTII